MTPRSVLIALSLLGGCSGAPGSGTPPRILAEWHASGQVYQLDPLREEVLVFADGEVDARFDTTGILGGWTEVAPRRRRVLLSPEQRETLIRLLHGVPELRRLPVEPSTRVCLLRDPVPPFSTAEVVVRYTPGTGSGWELRRSWVDFQATERLNDAFCRHLQQIDEFFRGLIWQD